jgi:hypothetical protein
MRFKHITVFHSTLGAALLSTLLAAAVLPAAAG